MQDFLLPENTRKVVRNMLHSLLTCPPPFAVAASVREVTRTLSEHSHGTGTVQSRCPAVQHSAQTPRVAC
jgi:hypothetical protein